MAMAIAIILMHCYCYGAAYGDYFCYADFAVAYVSAETFWNFLAVGLQVSVLIRPVRF